MQSNLSILNIVYFIYALICNFIMYHLSIGYESTNMKYVQQLQGQLHIWQQSTDFGHEAVKLCHWMRYLVAGCVDW